MYTYTHTHTHTRMYVCMYVCIITLDHHSICIHTHTHTHVCMYVFHVCMHVCEYVCTYICMYVLCIHMCLLVCVHVCVHVCVCVRARACCVGTSTSSQGARELTQLSQLTSLCVSGCRINTAVIAALQVFTSKNKIKKDTIKKKDFTL